MEASIPGHFLCVSHVNSDGSIFFSLIVLPLEVRLVLILISYHKIMFYGKQKNCTLPSFNNKNFTCLNNLIYIVSQIPAFQVTAY